MIKKIYIKLLSLIEKFIASKPDIVIILYYKYFHNLLLFRTLQLNVNVKIINKNKIQIKDKKEIFFTNNIIRIKRFYLGGGIKRSFEILFKKYCFVDIKVKPNDVIFDVGSNVGEFSSYFKNKNCVIYSFEPDPEVNKIQKLNLSKMNNFYLSNLVLSNKKSNLEFYLDSNNASSSLINKSSKKINISSERLDNFIHSNKIKNIRILKIDAEGAEPEVLEGIGDKFKLIDYITIDCSAERNNKTPINEISKILTNNNFEVFKQKYYVVGIRKDVKI